jgi:adenine-specific DNA-methyltransferase
MDFFAGSGTTGHMVLALEQARRFVLSEMGAYFDAVTKLRIARLMFSPHWKNGEPGLAHRRRYIVKVQRFEQYEDVVNNLDITWDHAALPEGVPLRYLFRPDQNRVRQSLNLPNPFGNTLRTGKYGEPCPVDLMETWALLQGYWVRSRKAIHYGMKRYEALETECGCLVLLRDVAEGEDETGVTHSLRSTKQWRHCMRLVRSIRRPCASLTNPALSLCR